MTRMTGGRMACAAMMVLGAIATGCGPDKQKQRPATAVAMADVTIMPITLDSVETGDEQYAAAPESLGGPLGGAHYVHSVSTRPTPALPAPIDSMRDSALVAYLNELAYDGSRQNTDLKWVSCATSMGACAVNDSIAMFIQPEIGIRHIPHDSVPLYGMVVARVIDYAPDTAKHDLRFGLPGHTRGWWVVEKVDTVFRSRFVVRTYQAHPAIRVLNGDSAYTKGYKQCPHAPKAKSRPSRAAWADCTSDTSYAALPAAPAPPLREFERYVHAVAFRPAPAPRPMYVALDGSWGTCDQWCCATK